MYVEARREPVALEGAAPLESVAPDEEDSLGPTAPAGPFGASVSGAVAVSGAGGRFAVSDVVSSGLVTNEV